MKTTKTFLSLFCFAIWLFSSGCIHEYPIPSPMSGNGENPSEVNVSIEVTYDLSWQNILYSIDFSTKATATVHRLVVEVRHQGAIVAHETEYLTEEEFITGRIRRKLPVRLSTSDYEISCWWHRLDEDGGDPFTTEDLSHIYLMDFSTSNEKWLQCAYACDKLDLHGYAGGEKTVNIVKELEMGHAGGRFEIIATDVQDFITEQKEALNQGDKFTVHLDFRDNSYCSFNAFTGNKSDSEQALKLSGWMRLPFAEYDELKIAEGFLFCGGEEEVYSRLSVSNTSLSTVVQTNWFTFPLKPGYITMIRGEFLTHPLDGIFNIDNVWAGDIIHEIL